MKNMVLSLFDDDQDLTEEILREIGYETLDSYKFTHNSYPIVRHDYRGFYISPKDDAYPSSLLGNDDIPLKTIRDIKSVLKKMYLMNLSI